MLPALLDELQIDAHRLQLGHSHGPLAVLRQLRGKSTIAALCWNDAGMFVFSNAAASSLTGYSTAELRRLSFWQLTPSVRECEAEVLWRAFIAQGEQSGEYQVVTKDGRIITAAYAARVMLCPACISRCSDPSPARSSARETDVSRQRSRPCDVRAVDRVRAPSG